MLGSVLTKGPNIGKMETDGMIHGSELVMLSRPSPPSLCDGMLEEKRILWKKGRKRARETGGSKGGKKQKEARSKGVKKKG